MKKSLALLVVMGFVALLVGSIYVLAFADTYKTYNTKDNKVNYVWCWDVDDTTTSSHNPSGADYPSDLFALEQAEVESATHIDVQHFTEWVTFIKIDDRDSDSAHICMLLYVSYDASNFVLVDSSHCSQADAGYCVKDWTFPKGILYGKVWYRCDGASGESTSVQDINHCLMQD